MLTSALAFVLTVLIEWPVLVWISRLGFRTTGLFCLCMNGFTWGTSMGLLALWPVPVPMLETAIILVEAVILAWFWRWRPGRAFLTSLAMNLTSWLLGTRLLYFLLPAS